MSLKCGIVGLPNVGKSTLFNALTKAGIAAENYPFCTIEPNVGIVEVPDPRLAALAAIVKPQKVLPAIVEFVDIAGLVAGASKGEGLGNQFLANIRETDAIVHVVRCFEDDERGSRQRQRRPIADIEIIDTELALADLADGREVACALGESRARPAATRKRSELAAAARASACRSSTRRSRCARSTSTTRSKALLKPLFLLTAKPVMYVGQRRRARLRRQPASRARARAMPMPKARRWSSDLRQDRGRDRRPRRRGQGGVPRRHGHGRTGARPRDPRRVTRCSACRRTSPPARRKCAPGPSQVGATAPQAAGVIHTDFEKGFIRAETIAYDDYIAAERRGRVPRRPGRCASRARTTSSRMAT